MNNQNPSKASAIINRLLSDRIIMLMGEINDEVASAVIAQMLYLQQLDARTPISLYIDSPGGAVAASFAILDVMEHFVPKIETVCIRNATGTGAVILASGSKGLRSALPGAIMKLTSVWGNGTPNEIQRFTNDLAMLLANATGQKLEVLLSDMEQEREFTPFSAQQYGLIDDVLS
ncbi:MAG TPA: ATP-dependent Clp protease proteolytic subunit [Planctomycetota bacterium]|nr:ATP-dependent Clp protease proteolytic subunit [Planctomycetota bacterium]